MSNEPEHPETQSALPTGEAARDEVARRRFGSSPMRYPNAYVWLLFFSALDIMLTWVIFSNGGHEVNPIAEKVIFRWGLDGMIVYKFVLVTFFILICETVGKLRDSTGKTLSKVGVLIAAFPVCWSLLLLLRHGGITH